MTGPITMRMRPGSAVTQAEVTPSVYPSSRKAPRRAEDPRALRLGMKKCVVFVKEPFPAREVARTLRL